MKLKESGPVNSSPSWAGCLHSVDSVSSGVPPWWLTEKRMQQERRPTKKFPTGGKMTSTGHHGA